MSAMTSYASEALLGPASQSIVVREFIHRCTHSPSHDSHRATCTTAQSDLPEKHAIEEECSVADLQSSLNETLSNPFKYAFLVRDHETTIDKICSATTSSGPATRSKKRKRTNHSISEESQLHPDVLQLRNTLENIALSCWSYPTDTAFFIHPQKNSDLNVLTKPKRSRSSEEQRQSSSLPSTCKEDEVLLVVSVYSRLSWGNHLSRSSQHAVLASQTIGDLYDMIPCPSIEIPSEVVEDGEIEGYNSDELFEPPPHHGAVVCIEGVAYGDGQTEEDYADKLVQQIQLLPERRRQQIEKGACMYDQRFEDLTLRLSQPYWLLHQGTCEHFLIIDSIRMLHPEDPKEGYPMTLHIAPPVVDLCMACSRIPATSSIIGDIRLGQSPFKICRSCWNLFGEPDTHEGVLVVPLPKYEHGW